MPDDQMPKPYPAVDASPSFPAIEQEILAHWRDNRIFERSVEDRAVEANGASNEFVFYDGPPFANGLPHYGHLVTGFVKDIVPRYMTMKGRRVERRFGWDCHGLPAELQSEKELGVSGRQEILKFGMAEFNAHCQTSVQRFTQEWRDYVTREGRWVDFENDYKTMDITFMESVMWAFKTLWDKGLIYEGYRVVPYSWAVQTPLSNFETRLDDSYRERQDPALTVRFTLTDPVLEVGDDGMPTHLLAWTTTPWTLPSNLALAVGPEIDYAVMEGEGPNGRERLIIGANAAEKYKKELEGYERVGSLPGSALEGRTYTPIFPYFADTPNAFRVLVGEFVDDSEGTGCVHMAPGFGEDDLDMCRAAEIPLVVPVDAAGNFTSEVPDYKGQNVIAANKDIIRDLKARGVVLRHETYLHNYPHCWRTDEPLIYKAVNSWYVKVTAFRERMAELNKGINWIPFHVRDGLFGNWLENARDWNISRNRFWGAPIPVWRSDDPNYPRMDVYGSLDEIERDFGVRPDNLHRPMIDELVRPNPDDPTGKSMMRRVEDVLDCWFESGSMPFAQVHYPFENKERFERNFPGDFIVEYVAQTRGWFYTLMVLSVALFDRAPFRNCICHGVVLDENRQKLSKRLRNYPDPTEVFDNYGADALRWYMISSPLMVGGDLAMEQDGRGIAQSLRPFIIPLWNAYSFFTLYANIDGVTARFRTDQTGVLDRYILAKTRELIERVEERMDAFDMPAAYAAAAAYVDALNNWYIRRSRSRFWSEEGAGDAASAADKRDAYDTLWTVLNLVCRTMAPLLPFVTEKIYRGLTGEESIHFADWPDASALPAERELVRDMDLVREVCAATMSIREAKSLRTRLPLAELTIAHPTVAELEPYRALVAEEVNVKMVTLNADPQAMGEQKLNVDRRIGKRIGAKLKEVLAAADKGEWTALDDGRVEIAGVTLEPGESSIRILVAEGFDAAGIDKGAGVVVLDTQLRPELQREGWARDFVRLVQTTRKDAGLEVTDRIHLTAILPEEIASAITEHAAFIRGETLALDLAVNAGPPSGHVASQKIEGQAVEIGVAKAAMAAAK